MSIRSRRRSDWKYLDLQIGQFSRPLLWITGIPVYFRAKLFDFFGTPVKTCLKVAWTPVKTCWKFAFVKSLTSDLLHVCESSRVVSLHMSHLVWCHFTWVVPCMSDMKSCLRGWVVPHEWVMRIRRLAWSPLTSVVIRDTTHLWMMSWDVAYGRWLMSNNIYVIRDTQCLSYSSLVRETTQVTYDMAQLIYVMRRLIICQGFVSYTNELRHVT